MLSTNPQDREWFSKNVQHAICLFTYYDRVAFAGEVPDWGSPHTFADNEELVTVLHKRTELIRHLRGRIVENLLDNLLSADRERKAAHKILDEPGVQSGIEDQIYRGLLRIRAILGPHTARYAAVEQYLESLAVRVSTMVYGVHHGIGSWDVVGRMSNEEIHCSVVRELERQFVHNILCLDKLQSCQIQLITNLIDNLEAVRINISTSLKVTESDPN